MRVLWSVRQLRTAGQEAYPLVWNAGAGVGVEMPCSSWSWEGAGVASYAGRLPGERAGMLKMWVGTSMQAG